MKGRETIGNRSSEGRMCAGGPVSNCLVASMAVCATHDNEWIANCNHLARAPYWIPRGPPTTGANVLSVTLIPLRKNGDCMRQLLPLRLE
jgi:hypothetical protein